MLKIVYDQTKQALVTTCSGCGGTIVINVSRTLPNNLLSRVVRLANERLTDATSTCPGCKGK